MELFVAGLHKSIRTDVKLMYPETLEAAMDHARAYEERSAPDDNETTLVPKGNNGGVIRPSNPEPAAPPKAPVVFPGKRQLMRLSPAEMDERHAKGVCYNCDDKFTPRPSLQVPLCLLRGCCRRGDTLSSRHNHQFMSLLGRLFLIQA